MSSRHHSLENEPRSRRNEREMEEKDPDYVPSAQCRYSNFLNISSVFGAIKHVIILLRSLETWPTCWSSSDESRLSSHGDIHPTIQTFISLVTMEPASLLARYSTIAADHDDTLLKGQPLSQLPDTSWYIPSLPAPPIPFVLSQCVLLLSLPSHIFFGRLRSIIRLERSYLVVTVSPDPTAYGPCLPCPCQVFLPISFMTLPRLR